MTQQFVDETSAVEPSPRLAMIIDASFDERSFDRNNLHARLSVRGQVSNQPALGALHRERYRHYLGRIEDAARAATRNDRLEFDPTRVVRQPNALIDGLWLEYCLRGDALTLADARADCIVLLRGHGNELEIAASPQRARRRR